jgi:NitT/TauT family transport system permease protein
MKFTATQLSAPEGRRSFGWLDAVALMAILALLWSILHSSAGMVVHFDATQPLPLSTDLSNIPYYAARTLLRMWIAFGFSLLFTFSVGYAAAKNPIARSIILPFMDVMQSIPVLTFLTVFMAFFVSLFPGSLLGPEFASIVTVFTGQVWNMAFGFYHSMVTIPQDLHEAATNYRLNNWQRFTKLEVPASMHSLIWNSMMSFGAGWFAVSASEAIAVQGKNIQLPGLGSFMFAAVNQGDGWAALWAVVAMLFVIIATDQLVWRPLLAWADKFKMELTESGQPPTSWFYNLIRRTYLFQWVTERILVPLADRYMDMQRRLVAKRPEDLERPNRSANYFWRVVGILVLVGLLFEVLIGARAGFDAVYHRISFNEILHIFGLGFVTLGRVLAVTVLSTLIWTPIGVWIGSNPRAARIAQPLVQIFASFPVNMTFALVVPLFIIYQVDMNWGCILLIALGAQWYILFNVIAGSMAIPNDMKEVAKNYRLKGWPLWRTLILPAIFPFWITGACTAAGGAWNATILAEVATWGDKTVRATGLGAYIADVSAQPEGTGTAALICGTGVMALFVVVINNLVWRRLYRYAEKRFHLD